MEQTENNYRQTVLVDTNAVHFLMVYLSYARCHGLAPFGSQREWDDIRASLPTTMPDSRKSHYQKGYRTLGYLQKLSDEDSRILISPFTKLELLHGLIEGRVHLRLSEGGMPYRMRQKLLEVNELVNYNLHIEDCDSIQNELTSFKDALSDCINGKIDMANVQGHLKEIISLCQVIQSVIFIEPLDCLIYSNSLIVEADLVVSYDKFLKTTISRIAEPETENNIELKSLWQEAQSKIRKALAGIISVPEEEIILPKCPGVPSNSFVTEVIR